VKYIISEHTGLKPTIKRTKPVKIILKNNGPHRVWISLGAPAISLMGLFLDKDEEGVLTEEATHIFLVCGKNQTSNVTSKKVLEKHQQGD